jgi:hypothetical protein
MTFALIWPSGLTDHISTVDSTQLEQLDEDHANALDGKNGGTYSLASQLRLTSSGYSRGRMVAPVAFKSTSFSPNSQAYQQASAFGGNFSSLLGGDLALFDGATITGIVLYFRIIGTHSALPATFPKLTCARLDRTGGVGAVSMNTGDAGSGLPISAAVTVGAYENSHNVQSFTYTVDQNGLIDASIHDVLVEVFDEDGANAQSGNLYCGFKLLYGGSVANVKFA